MGRPKSMEVIRDLHTRIELKYYNKLLLYGKGSLQQGIINLIKIADKQAITVSIITEVKLKE